MTQGKERIYISLEKEISPYIGDFMLIKDKYLTRPEAIEKGAKAICRQRASCAKGCTKCNACELWRNFVTHAEAVINDLLGVEQNGK